MNLAAFNILATQIQINISFSAASAVHGTLAFLRMANLRSQKDEGLDEDLRRKTVKKISLVRSFDRRRAASFAAG